MDRAEYDAEVGEADCGFALQRDAPALRDDSSGPQQYVPECPRTASLRVPGHLLRLVESSTRSDNKILNPVSK